MSVERRVDPRTGRVRFTVRWTEEGRRRAKDFPADGISEATARRSADEYDAAMRAEMRRRRTLGAFAGDEASPLPLSDWIDQVWRERGPAWEQSTREVWADIIDAWILPLVGHVPLRELGRARVREFRAQMVTDGVPRAKGRGRRVASNNRANAVMTVLSAMLGYAADDELIPENPCLRLRDLPHKAERHRARVPLVFERIRSAMEPRDALAVSLMYLAGLRPEEVWALSWGNVGEATLMIDRAATHGEVKRTKSRVGALVDIVAPLADDLTKYRESFDKAPRDGDLVIRGRQGNGILRLRPWRTNVWHPARTASDAGEATPYDGRHSFGSLLIREGHDILYVQRQMRHASSTITLDRYAHEFAEYRGAGAVSLIDEVEKARTQAATEAIERAEKAAAKVKKGTR